MLLGVETDPSESARYVLLDKYYQITLLLKDHQDIVDQALAKIKDTHNPDYTYCEAVLAQAIGKNKPFEELNTELEIVCHESNDDLFYEHASDYVTQVLNCCAQSLTFEQYDALRVKYDKTLVNHALKGAYYQAHQEIFGMPVCLIKDKDVIRNVFVIKDRYQAIRFAYEHANKNDCVVIAGKGHEDYQIFADKTIHFSDREICCELLGINEDGQPLTALNRLDMAAALNPSTTKAKSKASAPAKAEASAKAAAQKTTKAPAKATAASKAKAPVTKATAKAEPKAKAQAPVAKVESANKVAAKVASPKEAAKTTVKATVKAAPKAKAEPKAKAKAKSSQSAKGE